MKKRLTQLEVKKRFLDKNLTLLSQYIRANRKVKIKCYCGNIFFTSPAQIFSGNTRSCGCYNLQRISERSRIDFTGRKNGLLTAISPVGKTKDNAIIWEFKCDCGKTKNIPGHWVFRPKGIKSCGCLRHKTSCQWKGCGDISGTYWKNIQKMAKQKSGSDKRWSRSKDIEFAITIQDAWRQYLKQNSKCAISGVDIKLVRSYARVEKEERSKYSQTASLDRIDSSKGYIKGNIQWVHKKINRMKMAMSEKEFLSWCKTICDYNKDKISKQSSMIL